MTWNAELNSDATDELTYTKERLNGVKTYTGEDALEWWGGQHDGMCNKFAFAYLEENPNAIVKAKLVNGDHHCYVYDPDLDATIDATLGQFDGCPSVGMWDGENHPYTDANQKPADEYTDQETFQNDFDGAHSPFYL
jgi:hypothetical protein